EVEERSGAVAGGVLDREPGNPRRRGGSDVLRHLLGRRREAAFEVRADGHLHAPRDGSEMGQRLVEGHLLILPAQRPGEAGARRRQRAVTEPGEQPGAPQVPGIRDHEAAGLVELAKDSVAILVISHVGFSSKGGAGYYPVSL